MVLCGGLRGSRIWLMLFGLFCRRILRFRSYAGCLICLVLRVVLLRLWRVGDLGIVVVGLGRCFWRCLGWLCYGFLFWIG